MVYKIFSGVHAFAFCVLLVLNCIVFKREQREVETNRPLEQRLEVSAIYGSQGDPLVREGVATTQTSSPLRRFRRCSVSTTTEQSGSTLTHQSENNSKLSTSTAASDSGYSPLRLNFCQPLKSSLRKNSTSSTIMTVSPVSNSFNSDLFEERSKDIRIDI